MPRVSTTKTSDSAVSSPLKKRNRQAPPRPLSGGELVKRTLVALAVLVIAGCGGGGCSSGCACGGITPLPDGFNAASRIENGGSVRLTQSGITFLQSNLGVLAKTLLGGMGT